MIEWIDVLTILGVVMAGLAIVAAFAVLVNFARQALRQVKPQAVKVVKKEIKKEKQQMSKEKGE